MEQLLTFLLSIKRFPSVEFWIDCKGTYHALCSPSFERVLGSAESLDAALIDLVQNLQGYFNNEEKDQLKKIMENR